MYCSTQALDHAVQTPGPRPGSPGGAFLRPVGVMANDGIVSPGRRLPATAQRKGSFTARPSGGLGFEPSERLFIQEPSAAKTSLAKPCLKLLGSPFQDKTPQTPDRLQRNKESKILGADTWPAAALRRTPNKQQRAEGRGLKQQRAEAEAYFHVHALGLEKGRAASLGPWAPPWPARRGSDASCGFRGVRA